VKRIARVGSFAAALAGACGDPASPAAGDAALYAGPAGDLPPLVQVTAAGATQRLWPYTGTDFTGAPQDPMNLVFAGEADPRNVRAALLSLGGDRAGTPFSAFDCTWKDAIGGIQTTYSEQGGWASSVIQLECGDYDPFRFHVRLFPAGEWTLGQAHVEILVPGTHDHAVLSWEVGEQLVTVDLMRSGLLSAAPARTGPLNPSPAFGEILAPIYNGLPAELRAMAGGPAENVTSPVPIRTDGSATVLALRERLPLVAGTRTYTVDLRFGQTIPKPFCAAAEPYVRVTGPLRLVQEVSVSGTGALTSRTSADGELTVTGPGGDSRPASIQERHATAVDGAGHAASSERQLRIHRPGAPELLRVQLRVGPGRATHFHRIEHC
jgi:hypothetical protein